MAQLAPGRELKTPDDYLHFWSVSLQKAITHVSEAVGLAPQKGSMELFNDTLETTARATGGEEGSGLEYCNCIQIREGLAMVQDLPASERKKDEEVEFERWGQDHDKVLIITLNGLIDPALGWELYQASVLYEVKDIHKCPGWMEALKSNREMGGTLRLPIFMQGDRIYWGQVREDLRNMIRLFRRNQGTRFVSDKRWMIHLLGVDDPPPDLVIEHFAETPPARSMADMSSHTPRSIYASHPNNQLASAAVNGSWWQDDASASQGGLQERRNGAR